MGKLSHKVVAEKQLFFGGSDQISTAVSYC